MNMADFREYLKLMKFHSVGFTSIIPVIGAAATGELDLTIFFELLSIGILVHIFGFTMNEYRDIDVDRLSPDLKEKPLVKGSISKRTAYWIFQISWILALIVNAAVFRESLSFIFLVVSIIFGAVYNRYSKKVSYMEFSLAAWVFFFVLSGNAAITGNVSELGIGVAAIAFFQILFNTGISGAFKDIDHDPTGKGATTPLRMGVRVVNGRILVSWTFIIYSFLVKSMQIGATLLPLALGLVPAPGSLWKIKIITITVLAGVALYLTKYFLMIKRFERKKVLKPLAAIEVFSYMMAPIMLLGIIEWPWVVVLALYPFGVAVPLVPLIYRRIIPVV